MSKTFGLYVLTPAGKGLCLYVKGESPTPRTDAWLLVHRRFGHPGQGALRDILRCYRSQLPTTATFSNIHCEPCALAKSVCVPYPSRALRPARHRGEVVHTDIGVASVPSLGGRRYFVVFVDEYTRFLLLVYPLRQRSDLYAAFDEFRAEFARKVETLYHTQALESHGEMSLHADNAREYVKLGDLIKAKHGIKMRFSNAYKSQENGIAERRMRMLMEKMRAVLFEGHFPIGLWAKALMYVAYIINITPTPVLDHVSPYHYWFRRAPNIKKLHVFGCVAYVHIQKPQQTSKLHARVLKCIFVGYAIDRSGYRLLRLDTLEAVYSRDVHFRDDILATINFDLLPKSTRQAISAKQRACGCNQCDLRRSEAAAIEHARDDAGVSHQSDSSDSDDDALEHACDDDGVPTHSAYHHRSQTIMEHARDDACASFAQQQTVDNDTRVSHAANLPRCPASVADVSIADRMGASTDTMPDTPGPSLRKSGKGPVVDRACRITPRTSVDSGLPPMEPGACSQPVVDAPGLPQSPQARSSAAANCSGVNQPDTTPPRPPMLSSTPLRGSEADRNSCAGSPPPPPLLALLPHPWVSADSMAQHDDRTLPIVGTTRPRDSVCRNGPAPKRVRFDPHLAVRRFHLGDPVSDFEMSFLASTTVNMHAEPADSSSRIEDNHHGACSVTRIEGPESSAHPRQPFVPASTVTMPHVRVHSAHASTTDGLPASPPTSRHARTRNHEQKRARRAARVRHRPTNAQHVRYMDHGGPTQVSMDDVDWDAKDIERHLQYPATTGIDCGGDPVMADRDDPGYRQYVHALLAIKYIDAPTTYQQVTMLRSGVRRWTLNTTR
ncbi:TPA: hypothetical protein N0F65_012555 [Lagenidium giganteum]|uniref:Integrase catalytic domain-containing protein n=1 Tax=Lagenidium giganteum TaxID=4803 RepID=A0AAV2YSQ0_9STRA|nr:TPA: hypothetical protein N0F65_012555 [Lagenidium giganteum]